MSDSQLQSTRFDSQLQSNCAGMSFPPQIQARLYPIYQEAYHILGTRSQTEFFNALNGSVKKWWQQYERIQILEDSLKLVQAHVDKLQRQVGSLNQAISGFNERMAIEVAGMKKELNQQTEAVIANVKKGLKDQMKAHFIDHQEWIKTYMDNLKKELKEEIRQEMSQICQDLLEAVQMIVSPIIERYRPNHNQQRNQANDASKEPKKQISREESIAESANSESQSSKKKSETIRIRKLKGERAKTKHEEKLEEKPEKINKEINEEENEVKPKILPKENERRRKKMLKMNKSNL